MHTVTAKGFLFIMAPLRTGATIDFWLPATHQVAAGPVESSKINVPLLRHAHHTASLAHFIPIQITTQAFLDRIKAL